MFTDKESANRSNADFQGKGRSFFQPKLTVNQPNDVYEQEADHMADQVMRMVDSGNESTFFKPAQTAVQRKCEHCEEEQQVHRKESSGAETQGNHELDSYVGSLGSSGQALPESSRQFFEPRFGHDFSGVRIHTDSVAAKSAQSINALAYTTGNNIVFNSGQYSPESDSGKKLMAHELTHVVQQGGAQSGVNRKIQRKIEVNAGVQLDTQGFSTTKSGNVYTCPGVVKNSVWNEIFTSLLASPRVFKVAGATSSEANKNFLEHMKARLGIVDFASKKKYTFAAGSAFRMNPDFWVVGATSLSFKPGVDHQKALDDLNSLSNAKQYAIACEAATTLTMWGGSKSERLKVDSSSDNTDWVPGDAGYIKNTNFAQSNIPGLEGENLIYVGKDKFWGHFNPGNTYDTLAGWVAEVNSFDNNKGVAEIQSERRYTLVGLE